PLRSILFPYTTLFRSFAPLVVRPLPYSFNVLKGKLTNVAMEVVSTKGYAPKDFGYAAFNIEVVNPLSVTVFTSKGGETKLASARSEEHTSELQSRENL